MAISHSEAGLIRRYGADYRRRSEGEKLTSAEREIENKLVPQMEKYRPDLADFNYPAKTIEKDKRDLAEKKARRGEEYRRPKVLEAILWHEIEQNNWFGENCYTAVASKFDDEFRGTDLVLEFEQEDGEIVRLALDVTMDTLKKNIEAKKDRIIEDLEDGRLAHLKYFQSEADPETEGKISGIPKVIIGTDTKGIQKLSKMYLEKEHAKLAQSEIQIELLEEVKMQLSELSEYATLYFEKKRHSPKGKEVIQKYKEVLEIIEKVLEKKKNELPTTEPKARPKIFKLLSRWERYKEALKRAA